MDGFDETKDKVYEADTSFSVSKRRLVDTNKEVWPNRTNKIIPYTYIGTH